MNQNQQKRTKIIVQDGFPTASQFAAKRAACGWGVISNAQARGALDKSLYGALAMVEGEVIGFVRVIGDGALNLYIQDLIVDEGWRGRGVGGQLMRHIMSRIERHNTDSVTIGLMAADGKEGFYEAFGFVRRPAKDYGAGMTKFI